MHYEIQVKVQCYSVLVTTEGLVSISSQIWIHIGSVK